MCEPALKGLIDWLYLSKTILKNCLLLFKWPTIAVSALLKIYIFIQKKFYRINYRTWFLSMFLNAKPLQAIVLAA